MVKVVCCEKEERPAMEDSRRSHYYFRINEMGNMSEEKVSLFACPPNPSHYAYNRGSQRSETAACYCAATERSYSRAWQPAGQDKTSNEEYDGT